ncbi:MAG: formyltransferase family protein [Draconibacterium sp.]
MKSFCIYCSGSASRVIKFYSNSANFSKYKPQKVIYDGNKQEILTTLSSLFGEDLCYFDESKLNTDERAKIHTSTSAYIHSIMDQYSIEYLFCFGNKILKKPFIESYPKKLINFHPSILPAYKGLNAIDQALMDEAIYLGNTAHFMDDGIDTGQIILQAAMFAHEYEDYEDVLELQFPMMKIILRDILGYDIPDETISEEITKSRKILWRYHICDACARF